MHYPKISIIIPLYVICDRFFRDLKKFDNLEYPNYEILLVSDKPVGINHPKVKLILTKEKRTGPAEKRDIALNKSTGEICAFIDDDAYPDPNWLKHALIDFQKNDVGAVCGPGVTPPEDGFWEQVTGLIYESPLCGGPTQHRFKKTKKQFVKDFPAYNLLVKKSVLKKVGGYGSHFYGGEDTLLCLKIIREGWKIIYDPKVVIFHHRRPLFPGLIQQISNIGLHRGYFFKVFPETSRKSFYLIPSFLTVSFYSLVVLSITNPRLLPFFIVILCFALIAGTTSVVKRNNIHYAILAGFGIICVHLAYGTSFIKGLLTKKLDK